MKSDYDKAACVDWKTELYEYCFEVTLGYG